jgi:predicted PurR-regulated permease PerM
METQGNGSDQLAERMVRFGIVALLLYSGARIVSPFIELVVWGVILAVALGPAHLWLARRLGESPVKSAVAITVAAVLFILVPSVLLADALGSTIFHFASDLREGVVEIPPPPTTVQEWPVIGSSVHRVWHQASTNLGELLSRSSDQIMTFAGHLLRAAGGAAVAILQFAGSLIVAGFLLGKRESSVRVAHDLFGRVAPSMGDRLLGLAEQTVRSVASGVLGVAIIQATLVGIGLLVADVPFAGVWALLCLLLGIMQLPMGLIVVPIVIYQFTAVPTMEAVIFAAYMLPVMLIDNVLKPILLGRGVESPMIIIFVGALGGFAASGFIGLFTGAIVLVLVYEVFLFWLRGGEEAESASA